MMLSPSEIINEIKENLKVSIAGKSGFISCTSWSAPLKNGTKYTATLSEIPIDYLSDVDLMVKELYKITIDQLIEDAQNGVI